LVLFTGDAIDNAENISLLNQFLQLIDRDIPKTAILGNWEYWGRVNLSELDKTYKANNGTLLVNQSVQYALQGKTVSITGVDELLPPAINVDFVLSGHTHGGQINIFGFRPFLPNGSGKYVKGWYNNNPKMYVSKGIGTSVLPARLGARAEMAIFYVNNKGRRL
jgi:uncharacterized protein